MCRYHEYLGEHPSHFRSAHSKMAEVCLTYLNFESIKDLPSYLLETTPLREAPFLKYAACYWGVHARKELTERTKSLVLQFLDQYHCHISMDILRREQE